MQLTRIALGLGLGAAVFATALPGTDECSDRKDSEGSEDASNARILSCSVLIPLLPIISSWC
jgi:hypothetical protein